MVTVAKQMQRTRSEKVRFWMNPNVLRKFLVITNRLGYSRDGGIEIAVCEFIKTHKGDKHAIDRL